MPTTPEPVVFVKGPVPAGLVAYAKEKVLVAASHTRGPVLYSRIVLDQEPDPRLSGQAIARATLDVNGRPVRAHVAGQTLREAVDLLEDRLERRLRRLAGRRNRHGATPRARRRAESELAHGTRQPARPAARRRVLRDEARDARVETVDEAVFRMEAADDEFRLFTEPSSGQDAVVYRRDSRAYGLGQLDPRPMPIGPLAVPLTISDVPAPRLSVHEAESRLTGSGRRFLFFADAESGRGRILYARPDGHLGLIAADKPAPVRRASAKGAEPSDDTPITTAERALTLRVGELERQTTTLAAALRALADGLAPNPTKDPDHVEATREAARLAHDLLIAAGL